MDHKEKIFYESVLKFLCLDGQIDGIRFGPVPQLLISNSNKNSQSIKGQIYLNLASKWRIYNTKPNEFPELEHEISSMTEEEEISEICKLRLKTITNISLTDINPNLIIEFNDQTTFYMIGYDPQYESWQLGVAYNPPNEFWDVIAMPGGEITAFIPKEYLSEFES
jgi:hypothetical protein